jgi:hypothetical protein
MFTLRQRRRQRSAFVVYSIAHIFPDWVSSREKRDSQN